MFLTILMYVLTIVLSYLIGGISMARIFSKVFYHEDITTKGSGNPGSINMGRNYGFFTMIFVLFLDMLKSAIPCLVALFIGGRVLMYVAGLCCIIGHIYPIYYKFKGGKGLACSLGMFAVANPMWLGIILVLGAIMILITDIGSLTTLIMLTALTVIEYINPINYGNIAIYVLLGVVYLLILIRHRGNIKRLFTLKEGKMGLRKSLFKRKEKKDGE